MSGTSSVRNTNVSRSQSSPEAQRQVMQDRFAKVAQDVKAGNGTAASSDLREVADRFQKAGGNLKDFASNFSLGLEANGVNGNDKNTEPRQLQTLQQLYQQAERYSANDSLESQKVPPKELPPGVFFKG